MTSSEGWKLTPAMFSQFLAPKTASLNTTFTASSPSAAAAAIKREDLTRSRLRSQAPRKK